MADLHNIIALVTGASRGVGKGIAEVLGTVGAVVYVTGRSTRADGTTDHIPGTIEDTAEAVAAQGGKGIPVRCDHTVDSDVEALFERITQEQGRLDLLVNNAWGGYEAYNMEGFTAPFWEQPIDRWDRMFTAGVRAQFTAARLAARLMIPQKKGLIIGTSSGDGDKYRGSLPYDVSKTAVERMSADMAHELRPHNIAALTLQPGWNRTERVLDYYEGGDMGEDFAKTETPWYTGRAVAALAGDPNIMEKSGGVFPVGQIAREYDFTDVDGRQPEVFRF